MGKVVIKFQWLIVTILWIYILYRAVFIGITQDEAYSYFLVKTNYWRAMPGSLNTHWLNTLGMRLFLWLPGADNVWKLRLLSVLSWWLYSFSAIKLSAEFKNRLFGFTFFLAAVLNPYLILYFSLGRGYSVACAFLFFSFWQAFRTLQLKEINPANWLKVFLPASLAVMANFSFFYFFIGTTFIYILHLLVNKKVALLFDASALKWKLLVIGTSVFATFSLLFIRYHTKEFEGSESSDLVNSLFSSQIRNGLYLDMGTSISLLGAILFIILIIFTVISLYLYLISRNMTIGIYSILIAAVIILCNVVFYLVFKTPFLYGRTGLMFYVTLLPGFFGIMDNWTPKGKLVRYGLNALMVLTGFVFIFNFYKGFNIKYFSKWPYQADTGKGLDYLQRANAVHVGLTVYHFAVFTNYYSKAFPYKYKFIAVMIDESILPNPYVNDCDYLLITTPDSGKNTFPGNWSVKWSNPDTRTMILSKNK